MLHGRELKTTSLICVQIKSHQAEKIIRYRRGHFKPFREVSPQDDPREFPRH